MVLVVTRSQKLFKLKKHTRENIVKDVCKLRLLYTHSHLNEFEGYVLQDAFRDVLNEAPRALHNSDVNFIYGTSNLRKNCQRRFIVI